MLCEKPFVTNAGQAYGCGQCMPCRSNRVRLWQHRILLEAKLHVHNSFVTLTYDDEHLPEDGSVDVRAVQGWLKRLRRKCEPARLRYFVCGEYGERTWRPHYHAIIFGLAPCAYGRTRVFSNSERRCCGNCDVVRDTWGQGFVTVGTVEDGSAAYVCGYVTKKMTHGDDPRLGGRRPEFARMSLKPGLGRDVMFELADRCLRYEQAVLDGKDVPGSLGYGGRQFPLGRYLKGKLRSYVGREETAPQVSLDEAAARLLPVRLDAIANKDDPSLKNAILKYNEGARARFNARSRLWKKGRTL